MEWPTFTTAADVPDAWARIPALRRHLAEQGAEVAARVPSSPATELAGFMGVLVPQISPLRGLGGRLRDVEYLPGTYTPGATLRAVRAGIASFEEAAATGRIINPRQGAMSDEEWTFALIVAEHPPLWGAAHLFWSAHTAAADARAEYAARLTSRTRTRVTARARDAAVEPLARAWWAAGQEWAAITAEAAEFIRTHPVVPRPAPPRPPVQPVRLRD